MAQNPAALGGSGKKLIPVACELPAIDSERQLTEWHDLQSQATETLSIPGGVRMTYPASLESQLRDLAAREATCCAFLDISVQQQSEETVTVQITSPNPDALPVIAALAGIS